MIFKKDLLKCLDALSRDLSGKEILRADALRMTNLANDKAQYNVTAFSPFTSHLSRAKRKAAFTLAEVLITLGIIGVVAAMTMPTLIQKNTERTTVTHLKKLNTILSQAFIQIRNEEGGGKLSMETFNSSDIELMNRFGKYLKFQKTCQSNIGGCWKYTMYKSLKGTNYGTFDTSDNATRSSAILADGTLIMFNIRVDSTTGLAMDGKYAQIYVDLNGHKPPNQLGVDFFYWFLIGDRIIPGGVPECGSPEACNKNDFITGCLNGHGFYCTAWVIYNENMDYLHCNDLSWDGKTKCTK